MPPALTSGLGWRLIARLVPSGSGSTCGILLIIPGKCTQRVNHKRLISRNSHLLTTKLELIVPSFADLLCPSPAPQGLDQGQLCSGSPDFPQTQLLPSLSCAQCTCSDPLSLWFTGSRQKHRGLSSATLTSDCILPIG